MSQIQLDLGDLTKAAHLSQDRIYRYMLSRVWNKEAKKIGFICLNPSTADEEVDDPTVRRCISFAKSWGGGSLVIGNLFAYRSSSPQILKMVSDPIGPENDWWLNKIAGEVDILVAAWGSTKANGRDREIRERFRGRLMALNLTKAGSPGHPLYLPKNLKPFMLQS